MSQRIRSSQYRWVVRQAFAIDAVEIYFLFYGVGPGKVGVAKLVDGEMVFQEIDEYAMLPEPTFRLPNGALEELLSAASLAGISPRAEAIEIGMLRGQLEKAEANLVDLRKLLFESAVEIKRNVP